MRERLLPVAILAGGLATRLRPITETIPKSLIDIQGEPFIVHQLRLLSARGIERAIICAAYLGEKIQDVVGDGSRWGLQVEFSFDGPRLLGTAGAVKKALPLLGQSFFILYGDSYLPCDYRQIQKVFTQRGLSALMTVFRNDGQWDRSNVEFGDGKIVAYDKSNQTSQMQYIDYGLGVFDQGAFEPFPADQPFDLTALYQNLLRQGKLAAYEVKERFYEIGSFLGLEEMRRYIAEHSIDSGKGFAMGFAEQYLSEAGKILSLLDPKLIDRAIDLLLLTRKRGGRLFILGVGGSAANASHAVNDFRKIAGLEAYAPTDNVSELTARTNDEGWASVFEGWLQVSRLGPDDAVLVFSVGGGNLEKNISPNLVSALQLAKKVGANILGIVGRDGGYTAQVADCCILIPTVNPETITPHAEAFQSVIWHLLVSHPRLKVAPMKWESVR